jgi:hypothetical protein
MVSHRTKTEALSVQEARAITLLVAGYSVRDTAIKIGITPESLSRWNKNPHFLEAKQKAIDTLYHAAMAELTEGMQLACRELINIIKDPDCPAKTKIAAIATLLNTIGKHKASNYLSEPVNTQDAIDNLINTATTRDELIEAIQLKQKQESILYQQSKKITLDSHLEGMKLIAHNIADFVDETTFKQIMTKFEEMSKDLEKIIVN